LDQASAVVSNPGRTSSGFQHLRQVGSAEIRHAQHAKAAYRIIADRMDGHDMSVLKARQDPGLVSVRLRYLDRDEPLTEVDFLGEIDPGKSTPT
jgi:hypothetical protein